MAPPTPQGDVVVRAIRQEQRCKLCKTPHRDEIDRLLLLRSQRASLDDGTPVNGEYVRARIAELGVENPTAENLTTHWKRHCEVVSAAEEKEIEMAVESLLATVTLDELKGMTTAERLDLLEMQGYLELQARLKRTGKTGLTTDQLLRIAELKQRQKQNEDQRRFLGALGAGIVGAIGAAVKPQLPAPAHPDLDSEVIHETEGVVAA
jgi:hypothetical protein